MVAIEGRDRKIERQRTEQCQIAQLLLLYVLLNIKSRPASPFVYTRTTEALSL